MAAQDPVKPAKITIAVGDITLAPSPPSGFISLVYDTTSDQWCYKKPDGSANFLGGGSPITDTNTKFHSGNGIPVNGFGDNEEHYLDMDTKKLYKKTSGNWDEIFNFSTTKFLFDQGAPSGSADDGDYYQDVLTGIIYQYQTSDWILIHIPLQGGSIFHGTSAPSNIQGADGDYYLNKINGDFYKKGGGVWAVIYNLGGRNKYFSGAGTPSNLTGSNDDHYFDTDNGFVYKKISGSWVQVYTPKDDQVHFYSGDTNPSNGLGVDGDHYFLVTNGYMYKKASGVWVLGYQFGFNGQLPENYVVLPTDTLTSNDIGKIVSYDASNGKVVVFGRDAIRTGQKGQWILDVSSFPPVPEPTVYEFNFSGQPTVGDQIIIAINNVFTFRPFQTKPFDIAIGVDLVETLQNAVTTISASYPNVSVETDNINILRITYDYASSAGFNTSGDATEGAGAPQSSNDPAITFSNSSIITGSLTISGVGNYLPNAFDTLFDLLGQNITVADVGNNLVSYVALFGQRWAENLPDFVEGLTEAINQKFGGDVTAAFVGDQITIDANINFGSNPYDGDITLTGLGGQFMNATTIKQGFTDYSFGFRNKPTIGRLISVANGNATIYAPNVVKIKLSPNCSGIDVSDEGYANISEFTIFKRLVMGDSDGMFYSGIDFFTEMGNFSIDLYGLLSVYNENAYYALTNGNAGDEILATRSLPMNLILGLTNNGK